LVFRETKRIDAIIFDDTGNTYKSPKEFLFPQFEKIMTVNHEGELVEDEPGPPTVIFGVKPCDLEALKVMTAVFTQGKFRDVYYERNWNNTRLIGTGCQTEQPGCFCRQRGLDPGYSQAGDIFMIDCGESYLAELITGNGRDLLAEFELETTAVTPEKSVSVEPERILDIQSSEQDLFNKIDWATIAEKCLGCGTCTYICPACHCFEFKDSSEKGAHYRYRCWDSCMYPKFTLHASGHNPRSSQKERFRQRVMHKFHYLKQNTGYIACTGCGRCLRGCPAGMNIRAIVAEIMEELK
jgi:ferredoxin